MRWSRGHLLVCITRFKDLIKSLFSRKKHKNKGSVYDMFINCMPVCAVVTAIGALQMIAYLLSPLFGVSLVDAVTKCLTTLGFSLFSFCVTNFFAAIIAFIAERKRITGVSFGHKVLITLLWPLFVLIQFPIDIIAIFKKNLGWKPIPHEDTTNFEALNKLKDCARDDSVSI